MGKKKEAEQAARKVLNNNPLFRVSVYGKSLPMKNRQKLEKTLALLRKAGLPE